MDLLKLANRFEYSDLKLFLEASLVESDLVTYKNAADMLVFADSHSCALLKEVAMNVVVTRHQWVRQTAGWKALKESSSLLDQVLAIMSRGVFDNDEETMIGVSALRKRLADRGLDPDGTREMLVKRWKQTEEDNDSS